MLAFKKPNLYWMLNTSKNVYMIGSGFLWLPKKIITTPNKTGWRWLTNTIRIYRWQDRSLPVSKNPLVAEGKEAGMNQFWMDIRTTEGYPEGWGRSPSPLSLVPPQKEEMN